MAYATVVGFGLAVAYIARQRLSQPFLGVSLAVLAVVIVGWLVQPRATLYVMLALTAMSDQVTVFWFPFVKNLSSRESISYLADAVTVSPLDLVLASGATISLLRHYSHHRTLLAASPMTRPVMVFTLFVVYGFYRGLSSGADPRIVVLIGRPMLYIALTFIIVTNECRSQQHRNRVLIAIIVGVVIQSMLSINYYNGLDSARRAGLASLNEHGSSLGHGLVIVALVTAAAFGSQRWSHRLGLVAAMVPVGYVVIIGQRRAGIAALAVAGAATAALMFWRESKRFAAIVPIVSVFLAGYLAAFWNSTSSAAFPAQAIKNVIAPGQANAADRQSDLYRQMETWDLNFTIRSNPLRGIGIGQPFLRPIPLPNLDFFELNAYQPHNQVLWVWIALGFGGFVAMLYLFGKALMLGTERARSAPRTFDLVTVWTSTAFVLMYAIYTYVDISWDARNTVLLGAAVAICGATDPSEATDVQERSRTESTTSAIRSV